MPLHLCVSAYDCDGTCIYRMYKAENLGEGVQAGPDAPDNSIFKFLIIIRDII